MLIDSDQTSIVGRRISSAAAAGKLEEQDGREQNDQEEQESLDGGSDTQLSDDDEITLVSPTFNLDSEASDLASDVESEDDSLSEAGWSTEGIMLRLCICFVAFFILPSFLCVSVLLRR